MEVYRLLRKEGVLFPKRNPRNQFLIKFDGKKSPIFEAIEGNNIYEVKSNTQEPSKMLSTKGTYTVKETDLFSAKPIVNHRGEGVSDRQRRSQNGYIHPRVQESGNTNLRMANPQRNLRMQSYTGHKESRRWVEMKGELTGRNQNNTNTRADPPSLNQTEVLRMKKNHFLEAKNLMMVFDEILRNSSELENLEGIHHETTW